MKKKKYPKLKYDILYKSAIEMLGDKLDHNSEPFLKLTHCLGMALVYKDMCKLWRGFVKDAACEQVKETRQRELAETKKSYKTSLQEAYDVVCEVGGEGVYEKLLTLQEEGKVQKKEGNYEN